MNTLEQLSRTLKEQSLFSSLDLKSIGKLAQTCVIRSYSRAQVILQQGMRSDSILLILEGRVSVHRVLPSGAPLRLRIAGAGELLAQACAFSGSASPVWITSESESRVCSIPVKWINSFPELLPAMISELSDRLLMMQDTVSLLSLETIRKRVLFLLLEQAAAAGRPGFRWEVTHSQIAMQTASSRESVSRALSSLKKEGLISTPSRGEYAILDEEACMLLLEMS